VAHILEFYVGKQFSAGCGGDSARQSTNVCALQDASVLYLSPTQTSPPVTNTRRPVKTVVQSIDQSIDFASVCCRTGREVGSSTAELPIAQSTDK